MLQKYAVLDKQKAPKLGAFKNALMVTNKA
jgi:hypothetical protein